MSLYIWLICTTNANTQINQSEIKAKSATRVKRGKKEVSRSFVEFRAIDWLKVRREQVHDPFIRRISSLHCKLRRVL